MDRLVTVVRRAHGRAEMVRRSPPTERQTVVGRPLPVDDQTPVVCEGLAPGQPVPAQKLPGSGSVAIISE